MSSRKDMDTELCDAWIERHLQNWLSYCHPPQDVKERLLRAATLLPGDVERRPRFWHHGILGLSSILGVASSLMKVILQPPESYPDFNRISTSSDYSYWSMQLSMVQTLSQRRGLLILLN